MAHVRSPVRVQIAYRAGRKFTELVEKFSANFCLLGSQVLDSVRFRMLISMPNRLSLA